MIPKVVWWIWLNEKPLSDPLMLKCLESWKKSGYEIKRIGLDNLEIPNEYVRTLVEKKRWVLVSNYMRMYYLYQYGGIYADTDVELVKPLDDLLDNSCVLGCEDERSVNNAVALASPKHWLIKEVMEKIEKDLSDPSLRGDATGPRVLSSILGAYGWSGNKIQRVKDVLILDNQAFYPFHYTKPFTPDCVTPKTYCIHYWNFSWKDDLTDNRLIQP